MRESGSHEKHTKRNTNAEQTHNSECRAHQTVMITVVGKCNTRTANHDKHVVEPVRARFGSRSLGAPSSAFERIGLTRRGSRIVPVGKAKPAYRARSITRTHRFEPRTRVTLRRACRSAPITFPGVSRLRGRAIHVFIGKKLSKREVNTPEARISSCWA